MNKQVFLQVAKYRLTSFKVANNVVINNVIDQLSATVTAANKPIGLLCLNIRNPKQNAQIINPNL